RLVHVDGHPRRAPSQGGRGAAMSAGYTITPRPKERDVLLQSDDRPTLLVCMRSEALDAHCASAAMPALEAEARRIAALLGGRTGATAGRSTASGAGGRRWRRGSTVRARSAPSATSCVRPSCAAASPRSGSGPGRRGDERAGPHARGAPRDRRTEAAREAVAE